MQIPLKRIEGHKLAFDGGRIKVLFGEPLLLEKSTLRLCEIWSMPPSLERTRFERIYTMSIIFDFANDPNFLGLLTGSLRDVKYWGILFSDKKGFHQTMKAQIRGGQIWTRAQKRLRWNLRYLKNRYDRPNQSLCQYPKMNIQHSEKIKIKPSELIRIWKDQPCQWFDQSNSGDLLKLDLIAISNDGYVTTQNGEHLVQKMLLFLDSNMDIVMSQTTKNAPRKRPNINYPLTKHE